MSEWEEQSTKTGQTQIDSIYFLDESHASI